MAEAEGIGAVLRALRHQAGRSQSEQADLLSALAGRPVTRNEVSRWENEARLLTRHWQQHHAASYGVPVATIRRAVAVTTVGRKAGKKAEDTVQRRDFIGAAAGLAVLAPGVLHRSPAPRLGTSEITQLHRRTARLRRLDDYLGGADTYRLYASQLEAATSLAKHGTCTSDARQALTGLIAEQAQLAGWPAFDAGMQIQAKQHFVASLAAAKEADNTALAGNSLAFLAYLQVTTDKPSVDMAMASYATAKRHATPRVRALLLERMAWTHAVAGQAEETERALAGAVDALREPDNRVEPDWVFWVDDAELNIMAGQCWTELRRPLRAVPILEAVLAQYDDTHARDKSLYLTWLAHAYLDSREIEQAASTAVRSIELATGIASVRPGMRINNLVRRITPHRKIPAVAQVLELARHL